MVNIVLKGIPPSKKNSKQLFRNGATGKPFITTSARYKEWNESAQWEVMGQKNKASGMERNAMPFRNATGKVSFVLTFFPATLVRADLTNKAESVMDLLVETRIIEDDNWFICGDVHLKFGGVDTLDPRVEIEITFAPAHI